MAKKKDILDRLRISVETWNIELAVAAAKEVLELGIAPADAIENGLGVGMISISDRFDKGEIFLPQVLASSRAMEAALEVFAPMMVGDGRPDRGIFVIGTVQGDVHEIGKNVVIAFLRGAGYNVIDLGRDVPTNKFIEAVIKYKAEIVGASALMTTTLIGQQQIVERLKEEGLNNIKTIFGGAPCTQKWVDSIGADAYCASGAQVVETVNRLMKIRKED